MEVKIGVADSSRELLVSSSSTPDEVEAQVADVLTGGARGVLTLVDDKGRRFVVPAARLAYVEIGPSDSRRVGFAVGG